MDPDADPTKRAIVDTGIMNFIAKEYWEWRCSDIDDMGYIHRSNPLWERNLGMMIASVVMDLGHR